MGCDIHLYFEARAPYGVNKGHWNEINIYPENIIPDYRDYELWGYLFNVRTQKYMGMESPFESRGVPHDSFYCGIENERDYHSITYFTAKEISMLKWPISFAESYFKIFCDNVLPKISRGTYDLDNIRVIVAFDN